MDCPNFYKSDYTLRDGQNGLSKLLQAFYTLGDQNRLSELLQASYELGGGQNELSELLQTAVKTDPP